jgi:hypothetical protein
MPGPDFKKEEQAKRMTYPIRLDREGLDRSIDPEDDIYSGMMKRQARTNGGVFTKESLENIRPRNRE